MSPAPFACVPHTQSYHGARIFGVLSVTRARSLASHAGAGRLRRRIAFNCHKGTEAAVSGSERVPTRSGASGRTAI
jgi:hypothetical protein